MRIKIPTTPELSAAGREGHFKSDHVITIPDGRGFPHRFGIGGWTAEGVGRVYTGGPMVNGPYAYAYGLAAVMDNHGGTGAERQRRLAEGLEHDLSDGDEVELDGVVYRLEVYRLEYIRLVPTA